MTILKKTRTTPQAKITQLEARREKVQERRLRFEIRASEHDTALGRSLPNLCRAEEKTNRPEGTPEYTKALTRYLRLSDIYDKERTARVEAFTRAEGLRQEEEALTRQIQDLKDHCGKGSKIWQ